MPSSITLTNRKRARCLNQLVAKRVAPATHLDQDVDRCCYLRPWPALRPQRILGTSPTSTRIAARFRALRSGSRTTTAVACGGANPNWARSEGVSFICDMYGRARRRLATQAHGWSRPLFGLKRACPVRVFAASRFLRKRVAHRRPHRRA